MNKTITREEFSVVVDTLVSDALAHLDTQQGKDWKDAGMPSYHRRHLKIKPRRNMGKTYTATKLACYYVPTLLVFHAEDFCAETVLRPWNCEYYPTNPNNAFTSQRVVERGFLANLGSPTTPTPPEFKLGIIEDAHAIEVNYGDAHLDLLRDIMFQCCKVVLELG